MRTLRITIVTGSITAVAVPVIVVNHFRQVQPSGAEKAVDAALDEGICQAISAGKFEGRLGEIGILPTNKKIPADYVAIVGLGDFRDYTPNVLPKIATAMILAAIQLKVDRFATILHGGGVGLDVAQATGILLKSLVAALTLLDAEGLIAKVIFCEIDPQKAGQIAQAARNIAPTLQSQVNLQVQERTEEQPDVEALPVPAALAPPSPPAPQPYPIYADIWQRGRFLYYRLLDNKPILATQKKPVPQDFLEDMIREMNSIAFNAQNLQSEEMLSELQSLGSLAYGQLLNDTLQERIRNYAGGPLVLILDKTTVGIPWEILHDRQEFLCRKFSLARRISVEGISPPLRLCQETKPLKMLMVTDPTGDLPGAEEECQRLLTAFSEGSPIIVKQMKGAEVTRMALLKELNSGQYHLLHYAGHARFDPLQPARSAWILADAEVTATQIGSLEKMPALVFANACESGAVAQWKGLYSYERYTYGLASAFLQAGVSNYLGTFWRIHDEASAHFAITFYYQVLSGATLGQAVQAARETVIQLMGWNELTWAGYTLYGDPTHRLVD